MIQTINRTDNTADREIVINRVLNAPRELVFDAWTNPEHVIKWWGPDGFTNTIHEMSVTPGGVWRFIMHGPDGTDYPNKIVFEEVVRPERLSYSHGDDEKDAIPNFHVIVTFEDLNGKTNLTMHSVFKSAEERDHVVREYGAIEGANQHIKKLEAYLQIMQK